VNVVANALLIPSYAIVGCLLATMLASLTSLGLRVAWFKRARSGHDSATAPIQPTVPE
jgi:peptidoglycan biosynthesis protein MviN/MurJ (putative lipid II flippase)